MNCSEITSIVSASIALVAVIWSFIQGHRHLEEFSIQNKVQQYQLELNVYLKTIESIDPNDLQSFFSVIDKYSCFLEQFDSYKNFAGLKTYLSADEKTTRNILGACVKDIHDRIIFLMKKINSEYANSIYK